MLGDFAVALAGFDEVLVTRPYKARDSREDKEAVNSTMLTKEITGLRGKAVDTPGFRDVHKRLDENVMDGDAVIFMGAGDITVLAHNYAGRPWGIPIVAQGGK